MAFEPRTSVSENALAFEMCPLPPLGCRALCPLPRERATAKWRELLGEGS